MVAEAVQKLSFINTECVCQESRQAQAIQKTLEKELNKCQAVLQKLQQEGPKLEKQLAENGIQGAEREATACKRSDLVQKFREQQAQFVEDYNLRRDEELATLQSNVNRVIVRLAKEEGHDMILQDVICVNSRSDITDSVIKTMNARWFFR